MNYISKRAKVVSDKPSYKKKEKSESGGTIYRYDEKHIEKRWKEKKEKLKKLEKGINKVKSAFEKDLTSDDERTRAIAAIVGIMEETGMRVGNEESAKEGTYGASTLKKRHVKSSGGKMKFDFPGKGAIEQHVEISNKKVIKVVKDLISGKKADDFVFEVEGKKIWDRAVNRYLAPHDISAKDLRGFKANQLMKEVLKKKKDFKEALDEVAEIVGHEPATLKNQYLDPELVEKHEGKGKKDDKKKKSALSIRDKISKRAALSPEDKEWVQSIKPERNISYRQHQQQMGLGEDFKKALKINSGVKVNQLLLDAWRTLQPFMPDGARMTSGYRTPEDQKRILDNYWYKFTGSRIPNHLKGDDRVWGQVSTLLKRHYNVIVGPPWTKAQYAHLNGNAMDISGADLGEIAAVVQAVSEHPGLPVKLRKPLIEQNNNAVHVGVESASYDANAISQLMSGRYAAIKADMVKCGVDEETAEHFESSMEDSEWDKVMGLGLDDEMGDWFEKAPIFRFREEEDKPEHEIHDVSDSEAKKIINEDPEQFFYQGLHKEFPDLEAEALEKVIETNAKFFFVFKYHENEDEDFQKLIEKAAELLSQQDARAFFYYHLHHKYPELGRGAIIQLIDTNPDSFFDLGLQKDYPDYEESAGAARNIKDPNKIELEIEQVEQLKDKEARLSKRAAPYGWWVSPEGKGYAVPAFGHMAFVQEHPELFGKLAPGDLPSYFDAFDKGWIRIAKNSIRGLDIELPNDSILSFQTVQKFVYDNVPRIKSVALSGPGFTISSSIDNFYQASSIYDFNKISKNAISKRAGPYGWWISPSGEMHQVEYQGHIPYILKNPDVFGIDLASLADENKSIDASRLYDEALSKGWLRAFMRTGTKVFVEMVELSDKNLRLLKEVFTIIGLPITNEIVVSSPTAPLLGPVSLSAFFSLEDFRQMEKQAISKRAKEKQHAGIFAVLPAKISKQFPSLGDHDNSKPHITVLYVGDVPDDKFDLLKDTVEKVIKKWMPFTVELDSKPTYFPVSKHSDGCKVAKMAVISKDLQQLHKDLKKGLTEAGIEINDHFPKYNPHVTLEYMDPPKTKYTDDIPDGSWLLDSVEVWGCGKNKKIPLSKALSKRAKIC